MRLSMITLAQTFFLFLFFLYSSANVFAFTPRARGTFSSCCIGSDNQQCEDDIAGEEASTSDGPTSDQSPGMGVELETGQILFEPIAGTITEDQTNALKGMLVGGRSGPNWQLTVDTTPDVAGSLSTEYIMNGKSIKLGQKMVGPAAAAVATDFFVWNPSKEMSGNSFTINTSPVGNWKIAAPKTSSTNYEFLWAPQITVSMPLEAINDLMAKAFAKTASSLFQPLTTQKLVYVTKDFFQNAPAGLTSETVSNDVLGFFSLVLSYAKSTQSDPLKEMTSIMPRTDFVTMFSLVKAKIPLSASVSLYDVVKGLACYRNDENNGGKAIIDSLYCTETVPPVPSSQMDRQQFVINGQYSTLLVKDWINSIQAPTAKDGVDTLTEFDRAIDGSIGGFGAALEFCLGTQQLAPLFEFRRLKGVTAANFESTVISAETEVIQLHQKFANAAKRVKRISDIKHLRMERQAGIASSVCITATSSHSSIASTFVSNPRSGLFTTVIGTLSQSRSLLTPTTTNNGVMSLVTPAPILPTCTLQNEDPDQGINVRGCICGSTTLPLLTIVSATHASQSCDYTAMPTSHVTNPISIETTYWTSNCQACTLAGGIADAPTCTTVSACTPTKVQGSTFKGAVHLSSNIVDIGDGNNSNGGADLRNAVFTKLRALCPDGAGTCDYSTPAVISNFSTVIDNAKEDLALSFIINDSNYTSTDNRDRLLSAAVASWQSAVSKTCTQTEYYYAPTLTGCNGGPIKRDETTNGTYLTRREDPGNLGEPCKYTVNICSGPNSISTLIPDAANSYENYMEIAVSMKLDAVSPLVMFICDTIINTISLLAMAVAPELVEPEVFADFSFETLCEDIVTAVVAGSHT